MTVGKVDISITVYVLKQVKLSRQYVVL